MKIKTWPRQGQIDCSARCWISVERESAVQGNWCHRCVKINGQRRFGDWDPRVLKLQVQQVEGAVVVMRVRRGERGAEERRIRRICSRRGHSPDQIASRTRRSSAPTTLSSWGDGVQDRDRRQSATSSEGDHRTDEEHRRGSTAKEPPNCSDGATLATKVRSRCAERNGVQQVCARRGRRRRRQQAG